MDQTTQNQDLLTLRTFVGAFNSALNDQSYAGVDGVVYNPPGQFQIAGPYGTAVEGQPVTISGPGAVVIPRWVILLGLGALAYHLVKKG